MDAAFVLPYPNPDGNGIRTHASSHHYGFGVVFTSHALDLKHIEGAAQVTASIKRNWQPAPSAIADGSTRDSSSGGKRISLSPMPIYLSKRSDECIWALMTTVTSLQSAASSAKRQNSVPAPVFQPIHPQFWGYLCLDFEDTYADPRPCYSAPPFFHEAGERTVNRRGYRKIFDRFDLSQISDYKELWKVNRNDKTYFSNG